MKEITPTMMIIPMSIHYAIQISEWTYENGYSIYSFHQNDDTVNELMNGEYYVCLDRYNDLSGYFCFGKSAQIPTIEKNVYELEMLDIGLGMKPILCGRGYGYSFVKSGLDFAKGDFNVKQIRLTVAAFNTRAIRIYEKIGFQLFSNVTHLKTQENFRVMTYTY
jgi:[ribosomal protein S18]-alanine N-acetyltransferase